MAIYTSKRGSNKGHRLELSLTYTQNKTENKSTIYYSLSMKTDTANSNNWHSDPADPYYLKIGTNKVWTGGGMDMRGKTYQSLTSGNITLSHDSQGYLTVPIRAVYDNSNLSISSQIYVSRLEINVNYKLPQIKKGISNVEILAPKNIEGNYTINFDKDRASAIVKVEASRRYNNSDTWTNYKTVGTNIDSGFTFAFFDESDRGNYSAYPETDIIDVRTKVSATAGGETQEFVKVHSLKMPDFVRPEISNINYSLTNWQESRTGKTLIEAVSIVDFDISATKSYQSDISKYEFEGLNKNISSDTKIIKVFIPNNVSGYKTLKFRTIDKRGRRSDWYYLSKTIKAYEKPKIEVFTANRVDENGRPSPVGQSVRIDLKGRYSSIKIDNEEKNNVRYKIEYRDAGSNRWVLLDENYTSTLNPYIFTLTQSNVGINIAREYRIIFSDYFNRHNATATAKIAIGKAPMILGVDGVGFGKVPEDGRAVDIAGSIYSNEKEIIPFKYEAGIKKLSVSSGKATLNFKNTFAEQPALFVMTVNNYHTIVGAPTINNDSALLRIRNATATGTSAWSNTDVYVSYIAIEKRD